MFFLFKIFYKIYNILIFYFKLLNIVIFLKCVGGRGYDFWIFFVIRIIFINDVCFVFNFWFCMVVLL